MTKTTDHNYRRKINRLAAAGQLAPAPGVYILDVLHDDWCQIWKGGACNCNPDLDLVTPNLHQDPKEAAT